MKKLALAFILIAGLASCAKLQRVTDVIGLVTTTTQNPISEQTLYNFENGMIVAFAGLNAYKRSCVGGALPESCKGAIRQMQVYTKKMPAVLKQVRTFVKNNDQVNAKIAYDAVVQLMAEFKSIAIANNVKVQ
jgi:hypothetical protein